MKTKHWTVASIVAALAAAGIAGFANTTPTSQPGPAPVNQPTTQLSESRMGPADIYPPTWATGDLDLDTSGNTGQTLCNPNWSTKSIRPPVSYTNPLKLQQMKQLGLSGVPSDYEEDHLCSIEIGGSPTSTHNLWPEPYNTSIPDGGAKTKDKLENYLHAQICAGKITPQEACQTLVSDWYRAYKSMGL